MPRAVRLRIDTSSDGGWRVSLDDGVTRAAVDRLGAPVVQAAIEAAGQLDRPAAGVVIPGRDGARSALEDRVGRAIAAALHSGSELPRRLAAELERASAQRELLVLVVDATDAQTRALPWELLASGPEGSALEAGGEVVVARLGPGRGGDDLTSASSLTVVPWSPQMDDPIVSGQLDALFTELADLGVALDEPDTGRFTQRGATALHVVAHGERGEGAVSLALGGTEQAAGTVAHGIAPLVRDASVVVLDVCEGGATTPVEVDALAGRLMMAGSRSAVAAVRKLDAQMSRVFSCRFYEALTGGQSLAASVAAGRRAVRRQARPHPDGRWYNLVLWVDGLDTARRSHVVQQRWKPEGWPEPGPDAASLLVEARRLAVEQGAGFVGLEHLALALVASPEVPRSLMRLKHALAQRASDIEAGLLALAAGTGDPDWRGTQRLRGLADRLPDRFDATTLWAVMSADEAHRLHAAVGLQLGQLIAGGSATTIDSGVVALGGFAPTLATELEVAGGPDDGRVLRPLPGAVIGRWDEGQDPTFGLYIRTALTDRRLSRSHLTWAGPGSAVARKSAERVRAGSRRELPAGQDIELWAGDLLVLSDGTWLRAR